LDTRQVTAIARVGSCFSEQAQHVTGPREKCLVHRDLGMVPGSSSFVFRNSLSRLTRLAGRFQLPAKILAETNWYFWHQPKRGEPVSITVNELDQWRNALVPGKPGALGSFGTAQCLDLVKLPGEFLDFFIQCLPISRPQFAVVDCLTGIIEPSQGLVKLPISRYPWCEDGASLFLKTAAQVGKSANARSGSEEGRTDFAFAFQHFFRSPP
jgi:hypothetical protein